MNFRDIRPDLVKRLDSVREEQKLLVEQLRSVEAQQRSLETLLDVENQRFHTTDTDIASSLTHNKVYAGSIRDVALLALKDGEPKHLGEIKKIAIEHRAHVGNMSLGRILHGTLLKLKRDGIADSVGPGIWKLAKANPENQDRPS